jgi:RimJ/RimL family protein N-acetyltransferase
MEIRTERLILRVISEQDITNVHALHSLAETDRYNTLGIPASIEETKKIIHEWISEFPTNRYTYCIETPDKKFVGLIGIKVGKANYKTAEFWYKIHPTHWNKGYASEVVKHLLDFSFNSLGMHRIEAGCATANIASKKVLEKNGFLLEGLKRKKLPIRGEWFDNYFFAILEEDFRK